MAGVLLIYATTHGHTRKVAERVAAVLAERGRDVELMEAGGDADPDPAAFDAVIAAGSIHRERHQPELAEWARRHRDALAAMPTAFISVSLTAAEETEEAREATKRCIENFADETGWTPRRSVPVAGALQYLEYDGFTRTLMRLMMRRGGHPTDASRDYDYTDWKALDRLAAELAEL
jgi:menaquinone-dependent protoporphyrinogen oxidase